MTVIDTEFLEGWGNRPDAFRPFFVTARDDIRITMLDALIHACRFVEDGEYGTSDPDGQVLLAWAQLWRPKLQRYRHKDWIPGGVADRNGLMDVVADFVAYEETIRDFGGWDKLKRYEDDPQGEYLPDECDPDCLERYLIYSILSGYQMVLDADYIGTGIRKRQAEDQRRYEAALRRWEAGPRWLPQPQPPS
jgi:hypothetical protein